MSQSLRDFINARESEVKAQIKALNDELRELRTAKSAIDGQSPSVVERRRPERLTHRQMIAEVLDKHPDGGPADKVIKWVYEEFGVEIPQASMSSQLSRAKSDGVVTLDMSNKVWRSVKHSVKENEPPEGGSEAGEGDTSSDTQTETDYGAPSAQFPEPAGQTRHWKMPGT